MKFIFNNSFHPENNVALLILLFTLQTASKWVYVFLCFISKSVISLSFFIILPSLKVSSSIESYYISNDYWFSVNNVAPILFSYVWRCYGIGLRSFFFDKYLRKGINLKRQSSSSESR